MTTSAALFMTVVFVIGPLVIGAFAGGSMFDTDAVKLWRIALFAVGGLLVLAAAVMATMAIWLEVV